VIAQDAVGSLLVEIHTMLSYIKKLQVVVSDRTREYEP